MIETMKTVAWSLAWLVALCAVVTAVATMVVVIVLPMAKLGAWVIGGVAAFLGMGDNL